MYFGSSSSCFIHSASCYVYFGWPGILSVSSEPNLFRLFAFYLFCSVSSASCYVYFGCHSICAVCSNVIPSVQHLVLHTLARILPFPSFLHCVMYILVATLPVPLVSILFCIFWLLFCVFCLFCVLFCVFWRPF